MSEKKKGDKCKALVTCFKLSLVLNVVSYLLSVLTVTKTASIKRLLSLLACYVTVTSE